ncbi:MAG TPA: FtsW/RodA/SpoVE family cell cycle protein, partial [Acidimicrobiia bacterium]
FLPETGPFPLHGNVVNGARLWVQLDLLGLRLSFQPAEAAKLLLIIFLASYLAERREVMVGTKDGRTARRPAVRQMVPVVAAWVISVGVLAFQRDLGASLLLLAIVVAMLYAATGKSSFVWLGTGLFAGSALSAWFLFDHVQRRMVAWLSPFSDFEDAGFQMAQGLFALGTGSISGSGLGLGRPDLIPHATTDFVLAAVGEELGLAGTVAVVSLFTLLIGAAFGIALRARDTFRKLLSTGLALLIGLQATLIIAGILRLLPLTGVPLPFMSYGGSALVGAFAALALLTRVSHEEPR